MKKLLKINAIIILLFSSILIYFTFKNKDTSYWNNWGDSNISEKMYLKNTGYSGEDIYNLLIPLAKEEKVNIIKTDFLEANSGTKIVKSIFLANMTDDVFKQDTLDNDYAFEQHQEDDDFYFSTKKSNNKEQKAYVYDPFDDDYVDFYSLKKFQKEQGNLDGTYTIRSSEQASIQSFMKQFSERSGIPMDELSRQTTFTGTITSPIESITMIATVVSLLLFGILSIFYAVNNIKKIGVMKLNGYSNLHIWQALVVNIIYTMILSAVLLDVCIMFLAKNITKDFMMYLVIMQLALIGVLLCLSSIVYFIIRRNTISNLIKNKRPIKLITSLTYMIKSILLFAIVSFIVFMSASFTSIEQEYKRLEQWNKVSDLAVLVNVNVGNDQASFSQGKTDLQNDFVDYYSQLNKNGAIYVKADEFIPHVVFKTKLNEATGEYGYVDYFDSKSVPQEYTNINFLVNPNYLKENPIKDIQGKNIQINENDERTILIPDTMADMKDSLISIYTTRYKDVLYSDERQFNTEIKNIENAKIHAIIYKTDKNGYFTFNPEFEKNNYKASAPIFEVANEKSMAQSEKGSIQVAGLQSPLKINLHGATNSEYNQHVNEIAKRYHLDDNALKYMTIKEVFGNEIQSLKQACQQYFIAVTVCIIMMILITIQITQMLLEAKKKKYCVQKLNGYKFIDRFKNILFMNTVAEVLITTLAFVCSPALMNIQLNTISILFVIPLLILNFVLICCLLKYFENKNLTHIVKGE